MKIIAVLTERTSNNNQIISLSNSIANLTGGSVFEKHVRFNSLINLPNFILKFIPTWMTITKVDNFHDLDYCDLIISCGRRSSKFVKNLKNSSYPEAKIIQILKPNLFAKHVDLTLLPTHDKQLYGKRNSKKIIHYHGALICPKHLSGKINSDKSALDEIKKQSKIEGSFIGVCIGGRSKNFKFSNTYAIKLAQKLNDISNTNKLPLVITTSRRTPKSAIEILNKNLDCKYALYDYNENNGAQNPYGAILHESEFLISTGESISMISEVITFKKPLYIISDEIKGRKYKTFHKIVTENGHARILPYNNKLEHFEVNILNNVDDIASSVIANLEG